MSKPIGLILYRGPSQLDGSPIVAIATLASGNRKTGDMVQTWILRDDVSPLGALDAGSDDAVCGDCPHRRSQGGACYVNVGQAPRSVWAAYKRGRYLDVTGRGAMSQDVVVMALSGRVIRLGAYGDPLAVPADVWSRLVYYGGAGHTGYTHQWRRAGADAYRGLVMASCDTLADYQQATAAGWRSFTVLGPDDAPPDRAFECLSDSKGLSCEECKACDGARLDRNVQPASVWIRVHGAVANRFDSAAIGARAKRVDALRVL